MLIRSQAIRDNGGASLEQIKADIEQATKRQLYKEGQHKNYLHLTQQCGLAAAHTEQAFLINQKSAEEKKSELLTERDRLTDQHGSQIGTHLNTLKDIESYKKEIKSLRTRSNQLPSGILELRNQLVEHLGIKEEELPFVGELLKIRSEDKEWEGEMERLLYGFGIRMLGPDSYYQLVPAFVNAHKLHDKQKKGIRLEYFRVPAESKYSNVSMEDLQASSAVNKINIKPNIPFYDWLEKELIRRFNLQCVSLDDFQKVSDGITKEGQIKTGRLRHVKDDRRELWDRRNFVLGWNNTEKIHAMENTLQSLETQRNKEDADIEEVKRAIDLCNEHISDIEQIKRYQDWNELNWQQEAKNIEDWQIGRAHV